MLQSLLINWKYHSRVLNHQYGVISIKDKKQRCFENLDQNLILLSKNSYTSIWIMAWMSNYIHTKQLTCALYSTSLFELICPWEMWLLPQISNFQTRIKDNYIEYFMWNCPQVNATRPDWWQVNIGSGNGLVPSGKKPLPEPMLTQISVAIWRH